MTIFIRFSVLTRQSWKSELRISKEYQHATPKVCFLHMSTTKTDAHRHFLKRDLGVASLEADDTIDTGKHNSQGSF